MTINRTIMELKLFVEFTGLQFVFAINRTIMELKHLWQVFAFYFCYTINRTIMELKHCSNAACAFAARYQSHHYGIETRQRLHRRYARRPINRTIMELKHWQVIALAPT